MDSCLYHHWKINLNNIFLALLEKWILTLKFKNENWLTNILLWSGLLTKKNSWH